jgi:hypothetical protein
MTVPEIRSDFNDTEDYENHIEELRHQIPCRYRHHPGSEFGAWKRIMDLCYGRSWEYDRIALARPETFLGYSTGLSTLWAAVQTELLTYRRTDDSAMWVYPAFNMTTLLGGLQSGSGV